MKYFWFYSPETTPKALTHPRDCPTSPEKLSVACTQTGLSSTDQKKLVDKWCELLPTLHSVRLLWLTSKVPQRLFEATCRMPQLEGVWIKWSSLTSIADIASLERLQHFHLGSSTQLTSIEPLRDRPALQTLGLENLSKIRHLDSLAALNQLKQLSLEGSMWTPWKVATLAPIGSLRDLRYLSLANLRAEDSTLTPLYNLTNLETLTTAAWWPQEQLAELRRRNPSLNG